MKNTNKFKKKKKNKRRLIDPNVKKNEIFVLDVQSSPSINRDKLIKQKEKKK